MAMSKDGRRGFDIKSVLKGCLPEDRLQNDQNCKTEEELNLKTKKERFHSFDVQEEKGVYSSENSAPVSVRDAMETKFKRKAVEEENFPVKKIRGERKPEEGDREGQDYNGSAFRKVGSTALVEGEDKDGLGRREWERLQPNPNDGKISLGLPPVPPGLAPPTYLSQPGANLFNPFLGLNMLQQAEMSSIMANKTHVFTEQNLLDAFGRSVAALPTPLTESLANVKGHEQLHQGDESNMHLKNRFPFNQIVNPMVEKLIHKNTSPLLIHSPINAANLSQNWCAKCNASFRMTSDLVYHMRSHHKREIDPVKRKRESYKLKCDVCNEVFKERHHLTRHMTSHL